MARAVGEIQTIFEVDEIIGDVPGISYNVAPTQQIAMIVDRSFEKDENGAPLANLAERFIRLAGVWCLDGQKARPRVLR